MSDHGFSEDNCPLCRHAIEDIDCILCMDVTNGEISEELIPDDMKVKPDWRRICRECPCHLEYDEENRKLFEDSLLKG